MNKTLPARFVSLETVLGKKLAVLSFLCLSICFCYAQTTVSGKITSGEDSSPLPGVNILLKGTTAGTISDADGLYSIDVPDAQSVLIFSFVGYLSQEAIYNGILSDLEEANTIFSTAVNVSGDLIYNGDVKKWRKLANSLRVRYLMRISDRKDVSAQIQAILNDPLNNPVFENIGDNGVYSYLSSAPNQFPLFSSRIGSFNEFRASKTMVDFLKSLNDPRLTIYFRPTPATELTPDPSDDVYEGIPNGLDDVMAQTYNGGQQFHSRIGPLFYEQANSAKGIQVAKGVIMTFAELQFILAEAREKGLITTGAAGSYYLNGINASFAYYGVTPPANYFTQADVTYTGTADEKLEKTGNQKWAASYFQGLEAWFDWRRTGYPVLLPSVDNQNNDRIPVRFIYPRIEQSLNSANRDAAVGRQGADDINTRVWWDVN